MQTCASYYVVVWPATSCYADRWKRDHVTLVIIGRCTFEHLTVQHVHVARATCFHNVTHVARLFPKVAENENRTDTSNLRRVYWDNARMRMYGHDVQSINELFIVLREILIKCYKHSQKQLKAPPGEWQWHMQRILWQMPYNFTPLLAC